MRVLFNLTLVAFGMACMTPAGAADLSASRSNGTSSFIGQRALPVVLSTISQAWRCAPIGCHLGTTTTISRPPDDGRKWGAASIFP